MSHGMLGHRFGKQSACSKPVCGNGLAAKLGTTKLVALSLGYLPGLSFLRTSGVRSLEE